MQEIPGCHTLAVGIGKLGHRAQLSGKKEHHNQVFLKARHVFYISLLLLSCSLHCCPLVANPAPCSQVHHHGTTSQRVCAQWLISYLLPQSVPDTPWDAPWSAEPRWFWGGINMRSCSLEGQLWFVSSCYSRAVHFLGFSSLNSRECHTKAGYKNLSKLKLLSCCFCFMCPRQICI